jgi:hypothetical protein
MTLGPILIRGKSRKLHGVRSGEFGGWGAGWNLVLYQKLMLCRRDVTRHIVVVQFPIVPSFEWPNGIPQLIQNFDVKSRLFEFWLHSYHSSMLLVKHCTSHIVGNPDNF